MVTVRGLLTLTDGLEARRVGGGEGRREEERPFPDRCTRRRGRDRTSMKPSFVLIGGLSVVGRRVDSEAVAVSGGKEPVLVEAVDSKEGEAVATAVVRGFRLPDGRAFGKDGAAGC